MSAIILVEVTKGLRLGWSSKGAVDWVYKFVNYPSGMIEGDEEEKGYGQIMGETVAMYKYSANE